MDDDNFDGGILIATEQDLERLFDEEALSLPIVRGTNIKTGCYGLFLVALDQCTDPTEKATLEEALDALEVVYSSVASGALSMFWGVLDIDYKGILLLADVFIYLADIVPNVEADNVDVDIINRVIDEITDMLALSPEQAVSAVFSAFGFEPVEIDNDGPRQLELF